MNASSRGGKRCGAASVSVSGEAPADDGKTADIFGKSLHQFKQVPGHHPESPPLVFHLLVGYFMANPQVLDTEGLFRVAAPEAEVRELEIHLSQENYFKITTIENCHVVSNYWKKLMREMADPICPFEQYDAYQELATLAADRRVSRLRQLVHALPRLNFNTLKFIIDFMRVVVQHEPQNRMNHYNIAVTVGPNIFRPRIVRPQDLFSAGTYYDVVIKMMENFDAVFGETNPLQDSRMLEEITTGEFKSGGAPQRAPMQQTFGGSVGANEGSQSAQLASAGSSDSGQQLK